jgi:hypothetical protein
VPRSPQSARPVLVIRAPADASPAIPSCAIVGREGLDRAAPSSSQMDRFEIEWLATDATTHTGRARGGGALVADHAAREADQDWRSDGGPCPLGRLPAGRSGGVKSAVRQDLAPNRRPKPRRTLDDRTPAAKCDRDSAGLSRPRYQWRSTGRGAASPPLTIARPMRHDAAFEVASICGRSEC